MSYTRGSPSTATHSIDTYSDAPFWRGISAAPAAAVWPSADMAIYVPVTVTSRSVVRRMWWAEGSTGTGNLDVGLYDAAGVALLRKGSTAKGTSAAEVIWDCTDTTIGPGIYYLALACSNATDTFLRMTATAPCYAAMGVLTEASAMPLPATATFTVAQTLVYVPIFGMFRNATP